MSETEEIEKYAALHHGLQAYTYWMAYEYHKRRSNKVYKIVSMVGIGWHLWSVYKHVRDMK